MVRTQLYCYIEQYIGYTTTCFGPGYWPSSGCSYLIVQLNNMRWVLLWGGDDISAYSTGMYGHASQYYTTTCFSLGNGQIQVVHSLLICYTICVVFYREGRRDLVLHYWQEWPCLPILCNYMFRSSVFAMFRLSTLTDHLLNIRRHLLLGGGRRDLILQYWELWPCLTILYNYMFRSSVLAIFRLFTAY